MTSNDAIDTVKMEAELAKLVNEAYKLGAETAKLNAETAKLRAEESKLDSVGCKFSEVFWYPVAISIALIGAVVGVTLALSRWIG